MPHVTFQHGSKTISRYRPEESELVADPNGLGVAYVYQIGTTGKVGVIAYAGNAGKASSHYSYKSRIAPERM